MLRKIMRCFILLVIIFWNISYLNVRAASPLHSTSRMEGMLVVDVSNSMKSSDPVNISKEAMKMFIDMASLEGDKIGIIAYADAVMREKAMVKIGSQLDKKDLKSFIDSLGKYAYTDLSTGVSEAVKVLESSHEKNYTPLIVLLADGNNELNPRGTKTSAQADEALQSAVREAKAKGYPIYTIGLNVDGKLNKNVLTNVANSTSGKFFEATSAEQLPQILSEIFARHLQLKIVPLKQLIGNGDYQNIKFNVPNENVLEANISLLSKHPVEVQLINPSGQSVSIPSDQVLLTQSGTYSMVKLLKPVQGAWTLRVKGLPQDKIDINLIYNYDLRLKLNTLPKEGYQAGETVQVGAFLEDGGTAIKDPSIYQSLKGTLYVKDLDKGKTEEFSLKSGEQGFTGKFKFGSASAYEVVVKAEDNSFFRETTPQKLTLQTVDAAAPVHVKPRKTSGTVSDGHSFNWLYLAGGIAAIIFLAALASLLWSKIKVSNRKFSGQIVIEIKDEGTGDRTSPQYKKLKIFKGKFRLHQLVALAPEFAETDKVIFKPAGGDSLLLLNHSNCTIEKSGRAINAQKGLIIKRNDRLRIIPKQVNKSIYIEYIS
ncbi:VWA domain-containing protein [Neobacillus cucumis]|uniref:VWA domain-containing protein n=1 Tax=Neobacillus cucumis TaxID=1740721 RepID=A0A2N5HFN7_9BACI|nr:VWA domain-containing protein [Neobacillus cucumis]PLS04315.1 VWA domain-containing protein [Neobacillus cucumis]